MQAGFTVSCIGSTVRARLRYVMNLRHVGLTQGHVMATIRNRRNMRSAHLDGHVSHPQLALFVAQCRRVLRLARVPRQPLVTKCQSLRPLALGCRP